MRFQRSNARAHERRATEQSPHRATEWTEICRASLRDYAARQAMWPRAAPTPRACGSRGHGEFFQRLDPAWLLALFSRWVWARGIKEPLRDWRVSIHAAIAQKWPVAARRLNQRAIDFAEHDFFSIVAGF